MSEWKRKPKTMRLAERIRGNVHFAGIRIRLMPDFVNRAAQRILVYNFSIHSLRAHLLTTGFAGGVALCRTTEKAPFAAAQLQYRCAAISLGEAKFYSPKANIVIPIYRTRCDKLESEGRNCLQAEGRPGDLPKSVHPGTTSVCNIHKV